MIILYYGTSSKTSRQAEAWFDEHGVNVMKKRIERITRRDLVHVLSISENGFLDILKRVPGTGSYIHKIIHDLNLLNFDEAIDYLLENKNILKTPLIFDEHKLAIGYNSESIRMFLTKEYRRNTRGNK